MKKMLTSLKKNQHFSHLLMKKKTQVKNTFPGKNRYNFTLIFYTNINNFTVK